MKKMTLAVLIAIAFFWAAPSTAQYIYTQDMRVPTFTAGTLEPHSGTNSNYTTCNINSQSTERCFFYAVVPHDLTTDSVSCQILWEDDEAVYTSLDGCFDVCAEVLVDGNDPDSTACIRGGSNNTLITDNQPTNGRVALTPFGVSPATIVTFAGALCTGGTPCRGGTLRITVFTYTNTSCIPNTAQLKIHQVNCQYNK